MGTAVILFFIFSKIDFHELILQFREANPTLFISTIMLLYVKVLVFEAWTLKLVLSWFVSPTPYNDMIKVRGAVNLFHLLNVQAAMGGMYYILARIKKVEFTAVFGAILFNFIVTAFIFIVVITPLYLMGLFPAPYEKAATIITTVMWLYFFHLVTFWGYGWKWPFCGWMRDFKLFHALKKANAGHVIKLTAIRIPIVIIGIVAHWFGLTAFRVYVPFMDLFVIIPLVIFIGGLPISVSGFGTMQASFMFFLEPYGSKEALMAYSLSFNVGTILVKSMIGLVFFRSAYKLIFPPKPHKVE